MKKPTKSQNRDNKKIAVKDPNKKGVECAKPKAVNLPKNVTVTLRPLFSSDNIEFSGRGVCENGLISVRPGGKVEFTCNQGAFSVSLIPKTVSAGNPVIGFKNGCAPSGGWSLLKYLNTMIMVMLMGLIPMSIVLW